MRLLLLTILIILLSTRTYNKEFIPNVYNASLNTIEVISPKVNWNEIQIAAQLVAAEARSEPDSGQIAVLDVVKNRLLEYPERYKSVTEVIFDKDYFDGVGKKNWYNPDSSHFEIAKRSLIYGERVLDTSYLYFHNPGKSNGKYISTDRSWVRKVEENGYVDLWNHRFCKKFK